MASIRHSSTSTSVTTLETQSTRMQQPEEKSIDQRTEDTEQRHHVPLKENTQQQPHSVQQDCEDSPCASPCGAVVRQQLAENESQQQVHHLEESENPREWNSNRKWFALIIVSFFNFVTSVSSSMVAPALPVMATDLNVKAGTDQYMLLSIFVLAYSFGPLLWGPLSELYGRVSVLRVANVLFLAFNTGCGFAQSGSQMLALRFLSGFGGSAPLVLASGVVADIFTPEQRGKAISVYTIAPLLGPAIGPIIGGLLTEHTSWRWIFWATSILAGVVQAAGWFQLRETYAPYLLRKKQKKQSKAKQEKYGAKDRDNSSELTVRSLIWDNVTRAVFLLASQPLIQVVSVYLAYIYGLLYMVLSTLPTVWQDRYHESVDIGSLHYLAIGLGFFLGTQICAPVQDAMYRRLKHRNNGVAEPEFRIPLLIPAALLLSAGLLIYAWATFYRVHWIAVDIGTLLFSAGNVIGLQCITSYIIDTYTVHAASAVSAATFLRSIAGFGMPLLATPLYDALGLGWGNSLLALLIFAFGVPMPFLLWRYGKKIRGYAWFKKADSH